MEENIIPEQVLKYELYRGSEILIEENIWRSNTLIKFRDRQLSLILHNSL
jgi:hypothetical protein